VNPEEAFKIHQDVKAYNSIGIHWGTFKLSNEVSQLLVQSALKCKCGIMYVLSNRCTHNSC